MPNGLFLHPQSKAPEPLATTKQVDHLNRLFDALRYSIRERHTALELDYGTRDLGALTRRQASELIEELSARLGFW
jgi:hypothetical protein